MPIDYSRYPANWKTEIVPRVLARDENRCKWCSLENGAVVTSVALKVQDVDGRYKVKRFWLATESDVARFTPFCYRSGEFAPKPVTVVLTVAHLDHDETNHDVSDDRLAALCQYCHLNYDASEKYRRACSKSMQVDMVDGLEAAGGAA